MYTCYAALSVGMDKIKEIRSVLLLVFTTRCATFVKMCLPKEYQHTKVVVPRDHYRHCDFLNISIGCCHITIDIFLYMQIPGEIKRAKFMKINTR